MMENKIIKLSNLQEYDKERQAHLPCELKNLNDKIICKFNVTIENTTFNSLKVKKARYKGNVVYTKFLLE